MKAPISWLKEYVDINVDIDTLCKKMVDIGLEIEEVIYLGANVTNIVVGQITQIKQHPNADRLRVCQVDVGAEQIAIVTNSQTVAEGDKVPVALHGSHLANGLKITKGKMRGVESLGMFCGAEELGINGDYYPNADTDGVLVLQPTAVVGSDVRAEVGIDDYVIDVAVTSNRQDCNSVYGLAREVAVALGTTCRPLDTSVTCVDDSTQNYVDVKVVATDLCPNYYMQGVKDVTIARSPLWMTSRLAKVGLHGINNLVDVTNYVLMEVGQPMHAFDYADLGDKQIVVRRANQDETIVALDNKEYKLNAGYLVIADATKAVGLAGIMGGANSGIKDTTTCVMLEAARFKRENIRHSSRNLGLSSDSSARFEKGIDAYTTNLGLQRALHLIQKLGCGTVLGGKIAIEAECPQSTSVVFNKQRIKQLLGIAIDDCQVVKILQSLNIATTIDGDVVSCEVPAYRDDIARDCDIIEELIRVYGYDNIVGTLMQQSHITNGGKTDVAKYQDKCTDVLCGLGYHEAIFYPFGGKALFDKLTTDGADVTANIKIVNPIGEELSLMNLTLLPNMLQCCALNQSRKNKGFKLFEHGKAYLPKALPLVELPVKEKRICLLRDTGDFDTFRQEVLTLAKVFNSNIKLERADVPYLHPGISAKLLVDGSFAGVFGQIHPQIAKNFGVTEGVFVAEISFDALYNAKQAQPKFVPFAKFPSIERDFALVVAEDVAVQEVLDTILAVCPLCESASLFDVYRSHAIGQNKKSIAISVQFRHKERTLADSDVEKQINKCLKELNVRFDAVLR
ncbi:MAG: phenylalanine--tRNA ligase subunit beta [Clostridia bacterium]|nr:phenylalanine--tRNA ligase subunit beta [Clostridia bacterium]